MRTQRYFIPTAILAAAAVFSAGTAGATPSPLKDKVITFTTPTKAKVSLKLSNMAINPIPNLATTAYSREGFVQAFLKGTTIKTGSEKITSEEIELGLQIGCQIDVSSGLSGGLGLDGSASDSIGGRGQLGGGIAIAPNTNGAGVSGGPTLNGGGTYDTRTSLRFSANVDTTLKPGSITYTPIGKKKMSEAMAMIQAQSVHVKVDACGGPVTVRIVGKLNIKTSQSTNDVYVYADPHWI